MTPELYAQCRQSLDQILGQKAFGLMPNFKKAEINSYSVATTDDCDRFFRYLDSGLLANGQYADVKANWQANWRSKLPQKASDVKTIKGTIYDTMYAFGPGVKLPAGDAMKHVATEFIDAEMKRIFG
jgi:hypothetical protein